MKCKECGTENITIANYCKTCGNQFTSEEKEKAEKQTLTALLQKVDAAMEKNDKIKSILTLSFITDNVFVRLALLVIPFIIWAIFGGGSSTMRIAESDAYTVYYNTAADEYYLETPDSTVDLLLYVPEDTQWLEVSFTEADGYSWDVGTYGLDQHITIENWDSGYYTVQAQTDGESQSIVLYTVKGGAD